MIDDETGQNQSNSRATANRSSLMKNVVFVLNGFRNPLRSELQTKATSMGAIYSDEWTKKCTHLM